MPQSGIGHTFSDISVKSRSLKWLLTENVWEGEVGGSRDVQGSTEHRESLKAQCKCKSNGTLRRTVTLVNPTSS